MEGFTPLSAIAGGALIGLGASALLGFGGRIAGISGIVGGLVRPARGEWEWRAAFAAGLLAGGLAVLALAPASIGAPTRPLGAIVVSGLLVGFGARLGGGCTSGHGVCGLSRLSARSLVATAIFMATAIVVTTIMRH